MAGPISYEVRQRIGYATLDRPDALNAIDESVLDAFPEVVAEVGADESVHALVVRGAGDRAFCVGLDLDLLGRAFADHDYFSDVVARYRDVLVSLETLPVPTVAVVNGVARAGGFELLLACDLVVVADEARVGDTHVAFGVMPGGGATVRAPAKLGSQVANDLLLTGRWLDGIECVAVGLAARHAPRADLDSTVESLVAHFRAVSRRALIATKAAARAAAGAPSAGAALEIELDHFRRFLDENPAGDEGYRAFIEGREPDWGRS